jgi:hypothetical protein
MKLSKKQAAQRLGCSIKTIENRMKAGLLQFEKMPDTVGNGFKGNARVWVILPDDPVPPSPQRAERTEVRPAPQYEDEPVSDSDTRDRDFADRYLAGEATDSLGNRNDSTRKSLLGPTDTERMPEPKSDCTSHMNPALLGTPGHQRVENPVDSDDFMERLHPGHIERKAELYRLAGVRPLSQQQQKERNDKLRIAAAFRWSR